MRDFEDQAYTNRDDIPLKETGESDDDEEKQVYPPSSKLAPILIGLCFQSFCIALVSFKLLLLFHKLMWTTLELTRTTQSSQPPFPKSPKNLTH
jgi:hypothetical protein